MHLTCHLCGDNFKNMFYKDYASLEIHFGASHFLCPYESCKSKCYVAFKTENEYKAHVDIIHRNKDTKIKANTLLGFQTDATEAPRKKFEEKRELVELQDNEGKDFSFYFSQRYQMIHQHKERSERGGRGRGRGERGDRGRGRGGRGGRDDHEGDDIKDERVEEKKAERPQTAKGKGDTLAEQNTD